MSKKVFQRLLRSPAKVRPTDLLSDREYRDLSATSFEEYYRSNFNTEQLRDLTTAEANQLEMFYLLREKKADRIKKRLRDKPPRTVAPPVIVRYVPGSEQPGPVVENAEDTVEQAAHEIDLVVDNIERQLADAPHLDHLPEQSLAPVQQEPMETSAPAEEIQRALDSLDVSMTQIDLSQAMPPRELLLEELPMELPPPVPVGAVEADLDLGPPGDAAAFFGVDHPMPVSDRAILDRLRQEFPTLGRPPIAGRFEELDVAPMPITDGADLMPPPPASLEAGISASTPIVPNPNIRRFYQTNLSAIKAPALAVEEPRRAEQEPQVGPPVGTADTLVDNFVKDPSPPIIEKVAEDRALPEPIQIPPLESVPTVEAVPVQQEDVVAPPTVPAPEPIESSSSEGHPVPRPRRSRKTIQKVPTYTDSSIPVTMNLRSAFEIDTNDVPEMYEQSRALIQCIIDSRPAGAVRQGRPSGPERPSLPNGIEEHPIMRDISATQAELSSIREPNVTNQSKLYPIAERPQREQQEEQQLPGVSMSVPIGETTLPPVIEPVVPPIPPLAEVPLEHTSQLLLDTGLGNQMLFPDSFVNISVPQIVITDTSTSLDTGIGVNRETPDVAERPPPAERSRVIQTDSGAVSTEPVQVLPVRGEPNKNDDQVAQPQDTSNDGMLISMLKLYLAQQREIAKTKRNAITTDRLAQITDTGRVASARRFKQLLTLKEWGFIELETGATSQLKKISLRKFVD
nr:fibrous sheath CABYR-binding protein-like [Aedes albopictus]